MSKLPNGAPPGSKVVDKYVLMNVVGSGQFGDVYKAKRIDKEEFYAIKVISKEKLDHVPRLLEMTKDEVEILSKVKNPNIIVLHETLKTTNNLYIVYELCTGGTLEELLDKRKFLPEKEAFQLFRQILNGCKALVKNNIMHRDFKPSNILIHNNEVKLADFGFCKTLNSSQEVTETMVGSPIYMAPEVLKGNPYTLKADIYSLGVVLYEIIYGVVPFEDVNIPGLLNKIKQGKMVFHGYSPISPSTEYLLKRMLEPNDSRRIDWDELFDYFFIESSINSVQEKKTDTGNLIEQNNKQFNLADVKKTESYKPENKNGVPEPSNSLQNAMEARELKVLIGEFIRDCKVIRDKLIFLWRTFNQGCENLVNNDSHVINYLTLLKISKFSLEATAILQNRNDNFKKEEFAMLKGEIDFTRIFSILSNEVSNFEDTTMIYKTFLQSLPAKGKAKDVDSVLEITGHTFKEEFYKQKVLAYVEQLKPKWSGTSLDYTSNSKLGLFINLLLDSVVIDTIYDNFFDVKVPFNDQSYLQNLFHMEEKELNDFADRKFKHLRMA